MGIYLGAEELNTGGAASAGSFPKRFIAGTGEITWPNNENIYPPQGVYPWTVPTEIKTVIDAGGSYPVRLLMVGGGHNSSDNYMGEVKDIIYDLTSSNYDTGSTTTISATVGDVLGKSGISGVAPSPATGSVNISSYTNTSAMTGLSVALPSGTKFDSNGYPFIKSIQLWKRAGASWSGDIRYVDWIYYCTHSWRYRKCLDRWRFIVFCKQRKPAMGWYLYNKSRANRKCKRLCSF
jgi:hypothetical protein